MFGKTHAGREDVRVEERARRRGRDLRRRRVDQRANIRQCFSARHVDRRRLTVGLDWNLLIGLQRLAERFRLHRVGERAQTALGARIELRAERHRADEQVVSGPHGAIHRVEHVLGDAGARRHRALLGVTDRDERRAHRRELVGHESGHVGVVAVRLREAPLQSRRERDHAVDARRYLFLRRRVGVVQIERASAQAQRTRGAERHRAPIHIAHVSSSPRISR